MGFPRDPAEEGRNDCIGGLEQHGPLYHLSRTHRTSETKAATMEPVWVGARPSAHILFFFNLGVYWAPNNGNGDIPDSLACLWDFFPLLLGCLLQP